MWNLNDTIAVLSFFSSPTRTTTVYIFILLHILFICTYTYKIEQIHIRIDMHISLDGERDSRYVKVKSLCIDLTLSVQSFKINKL